VAENRLQSTPTARERSKCSTAHSLQFLPHWLVSWKNKD